MTSNAKHAQQAKEDKPLTQKQSALYVGLAVIGAVFLPAPWSIVCWVAAFVLFINQIALYVKGRQGNHADKL